MSLADASKRFLPLVEADLQQMLTVPHPDLAAYYGMMHYHLGWADEMLQPVISQGVPQEHPARAGIPSASGPAREGPAQHPAQGRHPLKGISVQHPAQASGCDRSSACLPVRRQEESRGRLSQPAAP